jgi:hypothetical protein
MPLRPNLVKIDRRNNKFIKPKKPNFGLLLRTELH